MRMAATDGCRLQIWTQSGFPFVAVQPSNCARFLEQSGDIGGDRYEPNSSASNTDELSEPAPFATPCTDAQQGEHENADGADAQAYSKITDDLAMLSERVS